MSQGASWTGFKRYVLSAATELYTVFGLGGRDSDSFRDFGILPGFVGVGVHDRYHNYCNPVWNHLAGHQAGTAQLLRDFPGAPRSPTQMHTGPTRFSARYAD